MENQCVGLAEALGLTPLVKRVKLRTPWRQLSPAVLRIGNRWSLSSAGDRLDGLPPDILIATGRQSVSSSLAIRQMRRDQTFRIQVQDPGIDPRYFDVVVVPRHDRLRGPNVLVTKGALSGVTAQTLAEASLPFADRLGSLPHPRIAVLVGGSNSIYTLTAAATDRLANGLAAMAEHHGASFMVTASRRTGMENEAVLRRRLAHLAGEMWDNRGKNPYLAYLAHADAIVVTSDSVNMVSEAATTGKPVYVFELDGGSPKFQRFHQELRTDGITRPFGGSLEDWSYKPLDDTNETAAAIRRRLGERGIAW
jgi:mitochondrial fission protein ELM1